MHDERNVPTLPPEILENIVAFCSQENASLRRLSLVSTTCLALARRQLFAEITLDPPHPNSAFLGSNIFRISNLGTRIMIPSGLLVADSPCARFLAIIRDSEQRRSRLGSVAPFVRHLHLREGSGMSCWIRTDPSLPSLLPSLFNLLSFRLSRSGIIPIFWNKMPVTLRDAICKYVFSQTCLIEVRLSGLVFGSLKEVNSLLGACRGIRKLEIDHAGVQEGEAGKLGEEISEGVEKATLDTLILGPFTPILFVRSLLHPSCPMRVDTIRKLCLSISANFSEFAGLFHASACLYTLELVLTTQLDVQKYWELPPSDQLDLSKSPSLCNFRITFDILQNVDDLLGWLTVVLRTAINRHFPTCPNRLQKLSVVFTLFVPRLHVDQLTHATQFSGWHNLDAVLCGDGHRDGQTQTHAYSNLKQVDLEFILKKHVNLKFAPRFLDELVLDSPGLRERRLLSVNAVDACG